MERVKDWFGKYLYYSKPTVCIRGLIFSHSLVNHAVVSILIVYLTSNWHKQHMQTAAAITNVQEGLSGIIVILLAHFSDTYRGSFYIIVTTNAAYIAGLAILWFCSEPEDTAEKVYYGAVLALILGEAGRSAALKEFLDQQYSSEQHHVDDEEVRDRVDDEQLQDRQNALWRLPWMVGAVVPLSLANTTWKLTFLISTIVMGFFYLLFWCGYPLYFINSSEEAPYPTDEVEGERSGNGIDMVVNNIGQSASVNSDEATHPTHEAESEESGVNINVNNIGQLQRQYTCPARENIWSIIEKMKGARHSIKQILYLWLTFLVYSIVTAAGSTFFFEQMSNLRISDFPDKEYGVAVFLSLMSSLSKYAVSYLWELREKKSRAYTLVRIGFGLVCTILCCVTAWQVESRRLKEVKRRGVGDTSDEVPMSIFWLVPQFSLLGIMEGLAVDGLIDFFVERVAGSDEKAMVRYYASHTSDFVIGVGQFVIGVGQLLTTIGIFALRTWFDDSINMSRLDKYYTALTFLSLIGFCYYLICVLTIYDTNDESQESIGEQENELDQLVLTVTNSN